MTVSNTRDSSKYEYDPVFLNSLREVKFILCAFAICLVWTMLVCFALGYRAAGDESEVAVIFGMPSWVFWGIFCPWIVADVITTYFCLRVMKDDDLGEAEDETSDHKKPDHEKSNSGEDKQ